MPLWTLHEAEKRVTESVSKTAYFIRRLYGDFGEVREASRSNLYGPIRSHPSRPPARGRPPSDRNAECSSAGTTRAAAPSRRRNPSTPRPNPRSGGTKVRAAIHSRAVNQRKQPFPENSLPFSGPTR